MLMRVCTCVHTHTQACMLKCIYTYRCMDTRSTLALACMCACILDCNTLQHTATHTRSTLALACMCACILEALLQTNMQTNKLTHISSQTYSNGSYMYWCVLLLTLFEIDTTYHNVSQYVFMWHSTAHRVSISTPIHFVVSISTPIHFAM